MRFNTSDQHFDIEIYSAASKGDDVDRGELIYQKDFNYVIPNDVYDLSHEYDYTELDSFSFNEEMEVYPGMLQNYTLSMHYLKTEVDSDLDSLPNNVDNIDNYDYYYEYEDYKLKPDSVEVFNAKFINVNQNVIVDFMGKTQFTLACQPTVIDNPSEDDGLLFNRRRLQR